MSNQKKPNDLHTDFQKEVERFSVLFGKMDSENDAEATAFFHGTRKSMKKLNALGEQVLGSPLNLDFREIYRRADQEPGVDPQEYEHVCNENEQLRAANHRFALHEKIYQKKIKELQGRVDVVERFKTAGYAITRQAKKLTSSLTATTYYIAAGFGGVAGLGYLAYQHREAVIPIGFITMMGTSLGSLTGTVAGKLASFGYRICAPRKAKEPTNVIRHHLTSASQPYMRHELLASRVDTACMVIGFGASLTYAYLNYKGSSEATNPKQLNMIEQTDQNQTFRRNANDQMPPHRISWAEAQGMPMAPVHTPVNRPHAI